MEKGDLSPSLIDLPADAMAVSAVDTNEVIKDITALGLARPSLNPSFPMISVEPFTPVSAHSPTCDEFVLAETMYKTNLMMGEVRILAFFCFLFLSPMALYFNHNLPPITYYWTGLLILDHSYLVRNLTNSQIAETKALEPLKS